MLGDIDNGSITSCIVTSMTERDGPTLPVGPMPALCELGVLAVETGGHRTAVRGERTSMLLAALGLAGDGGVGTDELVEIVWPSPGQPATARQSLANSVLRLRKSFGASLVESTRRGYRIGRHVQSDRERFLVGVDDAEQAIDRAPDSALVIVDRALSLWQGEPWAGIERPVGVEADRASLLRTYARARRTRASALMSLGRHELASSVLNEILEADPYDELARYRLVRILSDSGRRAEALRTIREARRLFSERGLAVDAALVDVEQRLLSAAFASDAEVEPLPEQVTDFIGRQREIEEVTGGLRANRLVTLHGIGGSGKTRLAVQCVSEVDEPERSGFVDLAETSTRGQVELAFVRGLGLPASRLDGLDAAERVEALADAAASASGVVIIDNCEHVLPDVRGIVGRLLARPGRLKLLATSRLPLDIAGEYRYPIPEFGDAAELFRRRSAHRGVPHHDDHHSDLVARICELVDHLPLAIEIAAAQTPYRTLHEIVDELERGIMHRDATQPEPRHESMAAVIRWSHELLDAPAADAFVRLGVFGGPFQLADAAAVIEPGDTGGVLDTLVRNSLIERCDEHGRSTYRLAVPVRQYCAAELERRGATTDVLVALAEWLLEFTDRPYGDVWWRLAVIDEIDRRVPDALSAIAALRSVGRTDDATRLASRLGGAGRQFGHADEFIELLIELWPDCDDAEAAADALVALVVCADAARRRRVVGGAVRRLDDLEGRVGQRHQAFVHCERSLAAIWSALLGDADFGRVNDELRHARDAAGAFDSPIRHAHVEIWQSAVHLLDGDWTAAEAAARRLLQNSAGTVFDFFATSCLCHARLQLGDENEALQLATGPSQRRRDDPHGNLLGSVAAIARVQSGDIGDGLTEISHIQRRARRAPFAIQQDDAAIAIAYIAHLMHHDDLAAQILETGVLGYGPWIGYLVPTTCRDLGIPLQGHVNRSSAEAQERSNYYGTVAARVLDELCERHVRQGASSAGS